MHIPDGLIPYWQAGIYYLIAIVFWAISFKKVSEELSEKQIPLLGILAAGLFAAQYVNYPIPGGTSGHLVGAALAAAFVGPYGAIVAITIVLIIQSTYGDGGITALGVNTLNMGIVAGFIGYYLYVWLKQVLSRRENAEAIAIGIAGWVSIVIASFICALELAAGDVVPLKTAVIAMVGWHAIIGIGEAVISAAVLIYVKSTAPDLLELPKIGPEKPILGVS